jgi:hypothetical protein
VWRVLKTIVAVALIVCVLVVCISPFVDLDPTALSAAKAALALCLAIAGTAFLLCYRLHNFWMQPCISPLSALSRVSLLNLLCSRTC